MDIFYIDTVTIYNKAVEDELLGKLKWYPTVLTGVRLLVTKGTNITTSGKDATDAARLHIRLTEGKPYLPPLEWKDRTDREKYFTATDGVDFFVEGDTSVEDIMQKDFLSYMKRKYDNCFMVTNVDTYKLIPHLEIGGK